MVEHPPVFLGRPHTRRQVLAAALIGGGAVATGGVAAAFLIATGGDGDSPAQPASTSTPTGATPTATAPVPTPTPAVRPGEPVPFLELAPDSFERREFARGELVPWTQGVFYMDTATGAMTGYRLAAEETQGAAPAGERFVAVLNSYDHGSFVLDRATGKSWRWNSSRHGLIAAAAGYAIFAELEAGSSWKETGRYFVARPDMSLVRTIELQTGSQSRWLVQGAMAAVARSGQSGAVEFLDLETGARASHQVADPSLGKKSLWGLSLAPASATEITAWATYYEGESGKGNPIGDPTYIQYLLKWDGTHQAVGSWDDWRTPHVSRSPDGRYTATEQWLHSVRAVGEGNGEYWPAVLVLESNNPILRVRSASLTYGDNLPQQRWLADSSGFVVIVRDDSPEHGVTNPYRYAIISPAGDIEFLPRLPAPTDDWYTRPSVAGPVPSPTDPDLLSFGRFYLYNRRTGRWFIPNLALPQAGPAHWAPYESPWSAGPNEMVFALGHGGHGGGIAPALIALMIEPAGFPAQPPMRFVVAATNSCLNIRSGPSTGAESIACLPDGTLLTLDPEGELLWENATQKYTYAIDNTGTFALVRTPDGTRGWVSTRYLAWA